MCVCVCQKTSAREKLKEVLETLGEWGGEGGCLNFLNSVVRDAINETVTFE